MMRHPFKKGDKVRRTLPSPHGSQRFGKPGVIYTLTKSPHPLTTGLFGVGDDGSKLEGASADIGGFELVVPTNDLIIAEAERRYSVRTKFGTTVADYVIEVVREGWTPPPVPADLLAARKYAAARYPHQADRYNSGQSDNGTVKSFMDGAAWRKANPTA